jgi:hypothetical protein
VSDAEPWALEEDEGGEDKRVGAHSRDQEHVPVPQRREHILFLRTQVPIT